MDRMTACGAAGRGFKSLWTRTQRSFLFRRHYYDGSDELRGYGGNDRIRGGIDSDILQGVDGNDILEGGEGDDRMTGDWDTGPISLYGADTIKGGTR